MRIWDSVWNPYADNWDIPVLWWTHTHTEIVSLLYPENWTDFWIIPASLILTKIMLESKRNCRVLHYWWHPGLTKSRYYAGVKTVLYPLSCCSYSPFHYISRFIQKRAETSRYTGELSRQLSLVGSCMNFQLDPAAPLQSLLCRPTAFRTGLSLFLNKNDPFLLMSAAQTHGGAHINRETKCRIPARLNSTVPLSQHIWKC